MKTSAVEERRDKDVLPTFDHVLASTYISWRDLQWRWTVAGKPL